MNLNFKDKKIFVDGVEKMIMAGEIHYFRLRRCEFEDRIARLKASGCNTVATYIPWCVHEQKEGDFDFVGKYKQQYDLHYFLELVKKYEMFLIVRPGPFIMAEMVGDGVPDWVRVNYPEVVPTTWEGNKAGTVTLDYSSESFLRRVKLWYEQVCDVVRKYDGDNLVGFQLDNEIGMLSWVSNCPDLTDQVLLDFIDYLKLNDLDRHYNFDLTDLAIVRKKFEAPTNEYGVIFHDHLLSYSRVRFDKYVSTLESYAHEFGIVKSPFLINIHGTGGGRLFGYPIGISQLYKTYEDKPNYTAGSDIYFDDMSFPLFQDIYMANVLTDATLSADQPLTSLEFNSVDGDYSNSIANRVLNSSIDIKNRIMLAMGNKLINYYLFSGGFNDYLNNIVHDGRDRIASTGEHHGYGAPIDPFGNESYFYNTNRDFTRMVSNLEDKFASQLPVYDDMSIAFIPDYFKTEYHYDLCTENKVIFDELSRFRGSSCYDTVVRYMLSRNYMPNVQNIQDMEIQDVKLLVVPSCLYMSVEVQTKLVNHAKSGGVVILYGRIPLFDMHGNDCSLIADYLEVTGLKNEEVIYGSGKYLTATPVGYQSGLVSTFIYNCQSFDLENPDIAVLKLYDQERFCGLDYKNIIAITCEYRMDQLFFDNVFAKYGFKSNLEVNTKFIGSYGFVTKSDDEMMISMINFDDYERQIKLKYKDYDILEGEDLFLSPRGCKIIPVNLEFNGIKIIYASHELLDGLNFKMDGSKFFVKFEVKEGYVVSFEDSCFSQGLHKVVKERLYADEFVLSLNVRLIN
jgi:beta-galactosidase